MKILWPSFLAALLAEACFFALIDPREFLLPPLAGYTIGFFFFWTMCALASMLTVYLIRVPEDDRPPF